MRVKMLVILVLAMLTLSFICLIAELYKATTKQIVTSEEEWNDCLNDETVCWKISNEKSSFDGSFASTPGIKYDVPSNSELVKPLHDKYTK
ncbi:uncharacterized protein MONOS_17042 [Monocercomonoides exilis]|uniref:uncharacterized protein n=1 Tax=Monocercomonoides exilis TaxID=2049356 RepID=UPI003559D7A6|nr:hypothetical protein MONOS_17042 [Monocercomonoides exilis]